MAQVLSQDEVNALLEGIATEQVEVEGTASSQSAPSPKSQNQPTAAELKPYDFTRNESSTRGRLPGLEVIFNNFARRLQSLFASELGKSVDVGFENTEVVLYETLIQSFPLPASIHLVRLEPLRGLGICVVESRLAYSMIEMFFGGTVQRAAKVEGRDFTPIERNFLGKFVERMLRGMEEAWQPVIQLKGHCMRSEMNPYLLNAGGMGDTMVVATYNINMANVSGRIIFTLPLAALEEFRPQLKSALPMGEDPEDLALSKRLQKPLMDVEVEVQAVVEVVSMSVRDIMGLRPGDIIQLSGPGLERVELWVEGRRKFLGKGAQRNGNKVFVASRPYGYQAVGGNTKDR